MTCVCTYILNDHDFGFRALCMCLFIFIVFVIWPVAFVFLYVKNSEPVRSCIWNSGLPYVLYFPSTMEFRIEKVLHISFLIRNSELIGLCVYFPSTMEFGTCPILHCCTCKVHSQLTEHVCYTVNYCCAFMLNV